MALHGARPNAHEFGRVQDGPANCDIRGEDVCLALRCLGREGPAQVADPHALRAVAGRRSRGVLLIITSRVDDAAGTVPMPVDDATLDLLLRDRDPLTGSALAITGIVVITLLMESKPF